MKRQWSVTDLQTRLALTPTEAHARAQWPDRWAPQTPGTEGIWVVTGATGVFGRHVVRALLRQGQAVMAPVRAPSQAVAQARLETALQRDPTFHDWNRLSVVAWADLGSWTPPPSGVAGVCHSAADLSLAGTAETMWATNVDLTQRMIAFARRHHARRFDHISTLSVWVAGATPPGLCKETDDLARADTLWGGYAATKWAADWAAPGWARELPLAIHRLGLLTVGSSEGWLATDPVAQASAAWARWGAPCALPDGADRMALDWSSVDTVADAVVHLMRTGALGPFHHASREAVTGAQWWHAHDRGAPTQSWPSDDPLGKAARRALGRWLQPERQGWWMDLFQSSAHRYDDARARAHGVRPWWPPSPLPTLQPPAVLR